VSCPSPSLSRRLPPSPSLFLSLSVPPHELALCFLRFGTHECRVTQAKQKMLVEVREHLVKTERDDIRAKLLNEEKQALAVERLKLRQRIIKVSPPPPLPHHSLPYRLLSLPPPQHDLLRAQPRATLHSHVNNFPSALHNLASTLRVDHLASTLRMPFIPRPPRRLSRRYVRRRQQRFASGWRRRRRRMSQRCGS
jgi:hypothetical protein